jgi:hypothetical protein
MPETVAGLFRTRPEAEAALRKLKEEGFSRGQMSLATPRLGRRGHYGLKVLAGVGIGTLLGAVVGAVVTGVVPGLHPLVAGNLVATFVFAAVAGAATGGVAGALLSMAAAGGDTLFYEQEVEAGRFLVSVTGPRLDDARAVLLAAGAMEAAPIEAPLHSGRPRPEA